MPAESSRPRHESMNSNSSSTWPRPSSPTVSAVTTSLSLASTEKERDTQLIASQYSHTTTGSRVTPMAAHALITRKDLRQSIACFEDVRRGTHGGRAKRHADGRSLWRLPKHTEMPCLQCRLLQQHLQLPWRPVHGKLSLAQRAMVTRMMILMAAE